MRSSLGLFVVACAAVTLSAQATPPAQSQRPTFRGGINYVRVDVYPTQNGRPVDDLRQDEIELLEDGAPQQIKDFDHIVVRTPTAQEARVEPNTVAEAKEMAADARARVFVLFLDTYHITFEGLATIRTPLVRFIDRLMGPDDMVAVMTPEMAAGDITFARKTTIIERILQREFAWARRERLVVNDDKDRLYGTCYPMDIAQQLIDRRREKLSLDALQDLVVYLQGVRDERKAVITISEGWRLYKPSAQLAELRLQEPAAAIPPLTGGTRRRADGSVDQDSPLSECEIDRMLLSRIDDEAREDELTKRANRSNVTFYPVDPRGLVVFDESIGSPTYRSPLEDAAHLRDRLRSLRTLAIDTDGIAVVDTNNINGALARIVDDVSSYYLLGYESTNSKLDGKFRSITVRVKRPGVQVRARKGYLSLRPEEVPARPAATATAAAARSTAVPVAVAVDPRAAFRLRPAAWTSGDASAAIWVVGEMDAATRKDPAWASGGTADISMTSAAGARVASVQVPFTLADGGFRTQLPVDGALAPGDYSVRVRVLPPNGQGLPLSDLARVIVPAAPMALGQPLLFRRGLATGTRYVATADPRFQRSDRLRLEMATRAEGVATARLLDASGRVTPVPVTVSDRPDTGGFRWIIADTVMAPLAAGDYAIEVTMGGVTQATAFRVVP